MSDSIVRPTHSSGNSQSRTKMESMFLLFPVLFIVAILPLIVRYHEYNPNLSSYSWFSQSDEAYDYFLYSKQWTFTAISGILLTITILRAFISKRALKFKPIFIPLLVYAACTILSTVFSEYKSFAVSGIYEQFENVFCLLGYVLVVYYIYITIETKEEVKMIINALAIGALLIGLIGAFQSFGYNIFNTAFGKNILFGTSDVEITFTFDNKQAFATLYNPNYLGVYTCMIIPIFTALLFFSYKHKWSERILYACVVITNILSLFGSRSKTGFISIIVAFLFLIIFIRKFLIKKWFITVPVVAVLCAAFLFVNHANNNAYINSILSVFKSSGTEAPLTDVTTMDGAACITYNGKTFYINMTTESDSIFFNCWEESGDAIELLVNEDSTYYTFDDEALNGLYVYPVMYGDLLSFSVNINGYDWCFTNQTDDNTYYYINVYGKLCKLGSASEFKKAFPKKYDSLATGRGYLWSSSIPLLKDNILIGSGPDSFVFDFAHDDYVGLYNNGFGLQLLTKPHSLYIQMGVQTGVVSLLAFLAFYLMYAVSCVRLYFKADLNNSLVHAGIALFMGTISYMVSAITNDSSITIAPVFWVIIGTGVVINTLLKNSAKTDLRK
ncbi:MAG: hypothetical protein E7256_11425 [Lachnospiraceae bacterium]|nr:hypothetical protein [Lachnospiraceae bacterium]